MSKSIPKKRQFSKICIKKDKKLLKQENKFNLSTWLKSISWKRYLIVAFVGFAIGMFF